VYLALYSVIKICHSIDCQEHDFSKIFKLVQEHQDKRVVLIVVEPFAKRCINLIKKQQGVSMIG